MISFSFRLLLSLMGGKNESIKKPGGYLIRGMELNIFFEFFNKSICLMSELKTFKFSAKCLDSLLFPNFKEACLVSLC